MHAPLPITETSTVAADDDALARVLAGARLGDEAALLDALEARRVELGLANTMVEEAAGLCAGHLTKVLGPSKQRSPTLQTLDKVLRVLGLSIVLVCDPAKRIETSWRRRDETHVRQRQLSATTLERARPTILAELARRASRPKWRNMPARDFVAAMVREASL
jgi:DNA-binding phage protein